LADAPTRSAAPCKRSSDHWSPLDDAIIFLFSAPMFQADASCFLDSAAKVFGGAIRISVDAPIFLFSASSFCSPTPGFSSGAPALCSRAPRSSTPAPCSSCGATCRYTPASITGERARTFVSGTSRMARNDAPTSPSPPVATSGWTGARSGPGCAAGGRMEIRGWCGDIAPGGSAGCRIRRANSNRRVIVRPWPTGRSCHAARRAERPFAARTRHGCLRSSTRVQMTSNNASQC
jgi:hypothetical protein